MDIQRKISTPKLWKKYWYCLPLVLLFIGAYSAKAILGDSSYMVEREKLRLAQVQRGHFQVEVRSTGVLKPREIRWVATHVSGRVEQVMVKPGAQVKAGDILVKLSNQELLNELEKTRWQLRATKAEQQAAMVLLESQLVDLENSVDEAEFNYKSTKLKLDAETQLIDQGRGSISSIDYQRTQLSVNQQKHRWLAQQSRTEKMRDNIRASQTAQQARIEVEENLYQRLINQVESLNVKATSDGIVQSISLALGQNTALGESVATIANPDSLLAELQVQEVQIKAVKLGQPVMIDTRSTEIAGVINRIAPSVVDGMVQVDVSLSGQLPEEARPDLNVEGRITVTDIKDTLFVKQPAFAPRFADVKLYKLSEDSRFANRQSVKFGQSSVSTIQILSGLSEGDTIITSETSDFQNHQHILVN